MPISKIKENSIATGAITEANVHNDTIVQQTEVTNVASNDTVLVYDTSAGALRKITQTNLLNFPVISSVSPTNLTSGDGTGNYTIVITGTGFIGATATLIGNDGTSYSFDSHAVDSNTQITGVIAKSSLPETNEPFDVRVTAASGLVSTLENQINIDAQPIFSTAAGSLGTTSDSGRASFSAITIAAADPESGGDVVYTLESGSLPSGLSGSSTSSGYVISGTPNAVGSDTTSNFTIRAKDVNSNTSDRAFSLAVLAPSYTSFTSSGTFTVPSGVSSVNVLVVAGGGGGGGTGTGGPSNRVAAGGGGAGGLIYRPGFPVTPGGTVSVTVGSGGDSPALPGADGSSANVSASGQDSVFGTLTAKGGGGGGVQSSDNPTADGKDGGSGGGGSCRNNVTAPGGTATQPTQSGESGNYGFGNNGGQGNPNGVGGFYGGGGGGGAGAVGANADTSGQYGAGAGGNGKAYTIADGTTSVYYAGGGAGGIYNSGNPTNGGQGGGGSQPGSQTGNASVRSGTANRGGGGAGGMFNYPSPGGPDNGQAGIGGKGIVIVQY